MPAEPELEIRAPKNIVPRIESFYAFFSVDEGGEGLMAADMGNGRLMPLLATDTKSLPRLRELAVQIARLSGKGARLVRFTGRVDMEEIAPQPEA